MHLRHAARTDVGRTRDHNEDSYGFEVGGERASLGSLFVVCDGIGGYASGEVASDLAVKAIIRRYYERDDADRSVALEAAVKAANEVVFNEGGGKIGTTGVAAVFKDDALIVANVGDCRLYLVRDGQARQITRDHSFVAEQVAAGMLTEEQAQESSYRHIITRALGQRPDVDVDLFRQPLLKDDVVVLCSDGLHGPVTAHEIALAVTKVPLDDACRALVKLANDRGGPDNITVVAVHVVELMFEPDAAYSQREAPVTSQTQTQRLEDGERSTARLTDSRDTNAMAAKGLGPDPERRTGTDRRRSDRRNAQVVAPPAPQAPTESGRSQARSCLLWMIGLLLIAAILFGGYYYAITYGVPSGVSVPALRPTLTPTGATATPLSPTLVPTVTP